MKNKQKNRNNVCFFTIDEFKMFVYSIIDKNKTII